MISTTNETISKTEPIKLKTLEIDLSTGIATLATNRIMNIGGGYIANGGTTVSFSGSSNDTFGGLSTGFGGGEQLVYT